jgi:hypothetical protein
VIKFVSDFRQVGGFLRVLRLPPPQVFIKGKKPLMKILIIIFFYKLIY